MKHLLSSTAFIVLNKNLAKQVGLKEAVLLADLISKEEYFIANGMTDGWFFKESFLITICKISISYIYISIICTHF